jgi:hypothetical protein
MEYRRPRIRFADVPGTARNMIYILRLVVGVVMLASSLDWLIDATKLLREPAPILNPAPFVQEVTA